MHRKLYRAVLTGLVNHWREEGDTAPYSELLHDAKLHLRWHFEKRP
jgi:hypothetical protein